MTFRLACVPPRTVTGTKTILAIDPGSEQSAYVLYEAGRILAHGIVPNGAVVDLFGDSFEAFMASDVVIEQIASYGMPVGREVFDTVFWCGRFYQAAWDAGWRDLHQMPRREVKLHLCQSARAKDANVRQALLDRFGGEKAAKGCKASPGPLYGLRKDEWQAAALAVAWWDQHVVMAQERA